MAVREFELFHGAVINDEVLLVVKHSANPRLLRATLGAVTWTFAFTGDQLTQARNGATWVALVCGQPQAGGSPSEVCLLSPDEVSQLLPAATQQSITVRFEPNKSLGAIHNQAQLVIPRNRLETWEIPGS